MQEDGRLQILNIHTRKMKANGKLADDVDLAELAQITKVKESIFARANPAPHVTDNLENKYKIFRGVGAK